MAHVNKLRNTVLRIAAAANSVKTRSCVRYENFVPTLSHTPFMSVIKRLKVDVENP